MKQQFKILSVVLLLLVNGILTAQQMEANMDVKQMKRNAAKAALEYIPDNVTLGVGSGSTVNIFIEELSTVKHKVNATVSSSTETTKRLKAAGFTVLDLNTVDELTLYIDGADAYNQLKQLTKGGGGALTQEKIVAAASKNFICLVDETKEPSILGTTFPIPIEVIPSARSLVAREIVKLGGQPKYREGFVTDNGNIILDVYNWEIKEPISLEAKVNQITGVVCNGLFAARPANKIIIGTSDGVRVY